MACQALTGECGNAAVKLHRAVESVVTTSEMIQTMASAGACKAHRLRRTSCSPRRAFVIAGNRWSDSGIANGVRYGGPVTGGGFWV